MSLLLVEAERFEGLLGRLTARWRRESWAGTLCVLSGCVPVGAGRHCVVLHPGTLLALLTDMVEKKMVTHCLSFMTDTSAL